MTFNVIAAKNTEENATALLGYEQRASIQYVENHGCFCPLCNSGILEGDCADHTNTEIHHPIECLECDSDWEDIYKLTELREITELREAGECGKSSKRFPQEVADKYIDSDAKACPFCTSRDLRSGTVTDDCCEKRQDMICLSCEGEWADVFTLSHIKFPN